MLTLHVELPSSGVALPLLFASEVVEGLQTLWEISTVTKLNSYKLRIAGGDLHQKQYLVVSLRLGSIPKA